MQRRTFVKKTGTAALISFINPKGVLPQFSRGKSDPLSINFVQPPHAAYPQTFWFWMNGHVTKEGITRDLEAMKRVGISGVFNFDAGTGIPKGPVAYLSAEWVALKKFAIEEAARLGLDFTLHNCPGWSSSGGPWITPELSMQQLTWSETYVAGGKKLSVVLPQPFTRLHFYKDIAVLAFPALEGEALMQTFVVTTNAGKADKKKITGEEEEGLAIRPSEGTQTCWLQYEFKQPFTARSLTFLIASGEKRDATKEPIFFGKRTAVLLEASDDGIVYKTVVSINTGIEAELMQGYKFITYDIPATTANYFRLTAYGARRFSQLRFSSITRLAHFMEKIGNRFQFWGEETSPLYTTEYTEVPPTSIIDSDAMIDVTDFIDSNGLLEWTAPVGDWTILRFGYTPIGAVNKAAPEGGIGLECDKFSREAITFHFNKMMEPLLASLKEFATKGNVGLEIDSYEAGPQNWSPKLAQEFEKRRRYNVVTFLPALTGRVVKSTEHTERFLWDFRRTQADVMADHYYGQFTELCHQHDFTSYVEPYDKGPFEEMQIGARADVVMGEYWNGLFSVLQGNLPIRRTPKLAASITHTNGKKITGVEAFTSEPHSAAWQTYPFSLKPLGDLLFTKGVNKLVIHRFAHQPHPSAAPGMTMGPWGIHFDRTNTWWEESAAWLQYNARCQYLLQQGSFVADLAYFTGEDVNIYTKVNRDELIPAPPIGYDYDLVNREVLLNRVKIEDNRLVLPDGMTYRVLVLQNFKALSLEVLQKIYDLVMDGMVVVGAKPVRSLGLSNDKYDAAFQRIAHELWKGIDGKESIENRLGRGRIFWGTSLQNILDLLRIKPDFEVSSRSGDAPINYIHRKISETHIYFIANNRRTTEDIVCTFRVQHLQPELWNPIDGTITPLFIYEVVGDRIQVPLSLTPYGSLFILFRSPIKSSYIKGVQKNSKEVLSVHPFPATIPLSYKKSANNFTITFWAKPETNIMLAPSVHMEKVKHTYTDFFAVYPHSGKEPHGEGSATCGLTVGRNGVVVWENASGVPKLVLAAPVSISGWNLIALQYRHGVPSVYVGGRFIKKGIASINIIYPSTALNLPLEGATYYNGDMTSPQIHNGFIDVQRMKVLAKHPLPENQFSAVVEQFVFEGKPAILIREAGTYTFEYNTNFKKTTTVSNLQKPLEIKGPWQVYFPLNSGAPKKIVLNNLMSLHLHHEGGVKYFSGTATYRKTFSIPKNTLAPNKRLYIDLGSVEVIARVFINGIDLGTLWSRPYKIDVTPALKEGDNELEIKVTNLWPNRLIGDEQMPDSNQYSPVSASGSFETLVGGGIDKVPNWYIDGLPKPADDRMTFTTWKHYTKEAPLLASGLIGPVVLETAILISLDELK